MAALVGAGWSPLAPTLILVAASALAAVLVAAVAPSAVALVVAVASSASAVAASSRVLAPASAVVVAVVVLLPGVAFALVASTMAAVLAPSAAAALVAAGVALGITAAVIGMSRFLGGLDDRGVEGIRNPLARHRLVRLKALEETIDGCKVQGGPALGHAQDGLPGPVDGAEVRTEELLAPRPGVGSGEPPCNLDKPDKIACVDLHGHALGHLHVCQNMD